MLRSRYATELGAHRKPGDLRHFKVFRDLLAEVGSLNLPRPSPVLQRGGMNLTQGGGRDRLRIETREILRFYLTRR
jgi:hypothetical protein